MNKYQKISVWVILTPIVLFLFLTLLFYFPPFQNWAVRQVAAIASEKTGMEISIDHVKLAFPLDLAVEGVKIIKQNDSLPQVKDTVADIHRTIVDVQLLPLFNKQVEVDELDIQKISFNTTDLIHSVRVQGKAKQLKIKSHGIDLNKETIMLNDALLDGADVDVQLSDTAKKDTTKKENHWSINLKRLAINNSKVTVRLPGDTIAIGAGIAKASFSDGRFDFDEKLYQVASSNLTLSKFTYDNNFKPRLMKGLDGNHLQFNDISIGLDTLRYRQPNLYAKIRKGRLKEKSGLSLSSLGCIVRMDSLALHIPVLNASTPYSMLHVDAFDMDLNAFSNFNPGQCSLKANAHLGKEDIMFFLDGMPSRFKSAWPHYPLAVNCDVKGNLHYLKVNNLTAELPTAFRAKAKGFVRNITKTKNILANVDLDVTTYNIGFVTGTYLDASLLKKVCIPSGISVSGKVSIDGSIYKADVKASQGGGWLICQGQCNVSSKSYKAHIEAHSLPVQKYLPRMRLSAFSGTLNVAGSGTDIFSRRTRVNADAKIDRFRYSGFDLAGTTAKATIQNGVASAEVNCVNKLLRGRIALDALMNKKNVRATLGCDLDNLDFYGMKLTKVPLSTSLCAQVDIASNLDDYYKVQGFVSDVIIKDSSKTYRPEDLDISLFTRKDTTWAKMDSGDLDFDLTAKSGYKIIMKVSDRLAKELKRQIDRKYISQDSLKHVLPFCHLVLHSGKNNMLARYAKRFGYNYREINADIESTPITGINGYAQIDSADVNGIQLDKIRLELATDKSGFKYKGQIQNYKNNPQNCFNALFDGSLYATGSDVNLALYDKNDSLTVKLGLVAMLEDNGIRVRAADTNPVLGYKKFHVNEDNFIFLADGNRLYANMRLIDEHGTGLQIYSDDDNPDAKQDITVGINHLNLASIVSVLPYLPDVQGIMNGDFHIQQTDEELSISSSIGVDGLVYEGCKMGDLSSDFVYIPQHNGGHYVDGMLNCNGNEVGTVKGTYTTIDGENKLDAQVNLEKLPLDLVNGFIPEQIFGLAGKCDGQLEIHGPLGNLDIDGDVDLDSARLVSVPYGVDLSIDNHPVKLVDSKLVLEDFKMYGHNNEPLVLNGTLDFSDMSDMTIDMRMKAENFLLIDSKQKRKSTAYGQAFVNLIGSVRGSLSAIKIRGALDVLGTSDISYIMQDSPLTTNNRLEGLVKFVDFKDSKEVSVIKPAINGLSVDLRINIDNGMRCFCALNSVKTNYVDLTGGGTLRFVMKGNDMRLTGRYTVTNGEMKYALPVIPLQTFYITENSYVEFAGDVMNPRLNITAKEDMKSSVNEDGTTRSVQFETGVVITKTLKDMGLEFFINAPDDQYVKGELQTLSKEERSKLAVSMLTTGMYLSSTSQSSSSAFSSFLQSEINSIAGNALRSIDLTFGIDNVKDETGSLHTDYSFKFAKRFWNNRIKFVIGGKVSSGTSQKQSIFDNVSLEYRLIQSGNLNLKVFYDRQTYDYLEGYVGKYGAGVVWKRSFDRFTDMFNVYKMLKKKNTAMDSVKVNSVK